MAKQLPNLAVLSDMPGCCTSATLHGLRYLSRQAARRTVLEGDALTFVRNEVEDRWTESLELVRTLVYNRDNVVVFSFGDDDDFERLFVPLIRKTGQYVAIVSQYNSTYSDEIVRQWVWKPDWSKVMEYKAAEVLRRTKAKNKRNKRR